MTAPPRITHHIPIGAHGVHIQEAVCGAFVRRDEHAPYPSCPTCQRLLAELDAMDFSPQEITHDDL